MAAAFLLNALLAQPDRPGGYVFAALTLLVTVAAAAVFPPAEWTLRIDPALGAGVMMVGLAYLAVVLRDPPQLKSVGDWTDEPLNRNRVLAGQLLALVAALAILLWDHRLGLVALSPLWAAMIGVIARRAVQIVRP
jgi:hypothetical protein